jgi:hypothetical protein
MPKLKNDDFPIKQTNLRICFFHAGRFFTMRGEVYAKSIAMILGSLFKRVINGSIEKQTND